jgi:PTH1 family peptidyl-tRNA hydrolase
VKLVVGLGNPGAEYDFSPHNMGFAVIDRLAERFAVPLDRKRAKACYGRLQLGDEEVFLIQPQTYMNLSGLSIKEWLRNSGSGPSDLLVLHDELDLPWGTIQIRQSGSSAGHHGVESIIESLGLKEFVRVRIGVAPDRRLDDPITYLLRPMRRSQRERMDEIVDRAANAAEMILREGVAKAMNRFNQRPGRKEDTEAESRQRQSPTSGGGDSSDS